MKLFADKVLAFYKELAAPGYLPANVQALFPFTSPAVREVMREFYHRFFADNHDRHMLIGINPGRYGAGITGINFTAPRQLAENCGIQHGFGNQSELSAEFIYLMIEAFGGAQAFYSRFYIASVSPVGYTRNGKNLNYYDDPLLSEAIRPFAVQCMNSQLGFGINRNIAICIGGDKNLRYLQGLNQQYGLFRKIISVPHPRFIMQYKRASLEKYIAEYLHALMQCVKE